MSECVAYQGEPGANSHMACIAARPELEPLPCPTFAHAFAAVKSARAREAIIPIDNSVWGRVADTHNLLPESGLKIVGEHFLSIHMHLLARRGTTLGEITHAHSHAMALGQCRLFLAQHDIVPVPSADTAGAARMIGDGLSAATGHAAIASSLAAERYGLDILAPDVQDTRDATTRFVILSADSADIDPADGPCIICVVFDLRNVPSALYKAMGGFATNGVNMTKLESYHLGGSFTATRFYAEIDGHPDDRSVQLAFEELGFFSQHLDVLGVFPAHPRRRKNNSGAETVDG